MQIPTTQAANPRTSTGLLLGLLLGLALPHPVAAATIAATWLGGAGSWSDATFWDSNPLAPDNGGGNTFDATLSTGAATVDADITLEQLTLAGGLIDGAFDLRANDLLTWTAGSFGGTGWTFADGGLEISGTSSKTLDSRTLENTGIANYRGGALTLRDNATLVNRPSASFSIDSDAGAGGTGLNLNLGSSGGGPNVFQNEGLLVQGGSQTTTISARLENSGSVGVQDGTLQLSGGGSATAGSIDVTGPGVLRFSGGLHDLDAASSLGGNGAIHFVGATVNHAGSYAATGTTRVQSGTATLSGGSASAADLELAGGVLVIPNGSLTVSGPLAWTGGTLGGAGTTFANGGIEIAGTSSKTLDEQTLENAGTANYRGGALTLRDNATLVNRPSASFSIDSDPGAGGTGLSLNLGSSGGGPNVFQNEGLLVQGGSQTTTISARLENSGSVGVQDGTLQLSGGGSATAGSIDVTGPGVLRFTGGLHDLDVASSLGGNGAIHFVGATVNHAGSYAATGTTRVQSGIATLTGGAGSTGTLELAGGVLDIATGTFTVTDALAWSAGTLRGTGTTLVETTLEIRGNASKTLDEQTFENRGFAHYRGGALTLRDTATFVNRPGASFTVDSDPGAGGTGLNLSIASSGSIPNVFRNEGSVTQAGAQTTTINAGFENSGTVEIAAGQLSLNGGYTQTTGVTRTSGGTLFSNQILAIQGGVLEGISDVDADVALDGTVAPGFGGTGVLPILGELTASASAAFAIELAGTTPGNGYDVVDVTGDVTLAGALSVSFLTGFDAIVTGGDVFTVLETDGSLVGSFANVLTGDRVSTLEGHSFQVDYGVGSPFGASLVVLSAFQAVPEPGSALLLGFGLAVLARRRSR